MIVLPAALLLSPLMASAAALYLDPADGTHGLGDTFVVASIASSQPVLAFGVLVQRSPQRPIDEHHEQAHHRNPEHNAMEITLLRRSRNVCSKAISLQTLVPP